jgi:hypothetical protein
MRRLLIHSTGWLSLLLWSAAGAQPLGGGQAPLTLPTPEGPKLNVPAIEPAQPLMLDAVRPLQLPPERPQPSLGLLPGEEAAQEPLSGEPSSEDSEPPRALYLEHDR